MADKRISLHMADKMGARAHVPHPTYQSMELNSCIDQLSWHLEQLSIKASTSQVAINDLVVDAANNLCRRHLDSKGCKVALHAWSDIEAACSRVHTSCILAVHNLLEENLDLVIPTTVVHHLAGKLNGALGVVLVYKRHVHVVDEVDQPAVTASHSRFDVIIEREDLD